MSAGIISDGENPNGQTGYVTPAVWGIPSQWPPARNPEACCYFLALDGNKHIFVPSPRLVHRCTCLNSQYSRAVKRLVTCCKNFATFLDGKNFPVKFSPPKNSPPTCMGWVGGWVHGGGWVPPPPPLPALGVPSF